MVPSANQVMAEVAEVGLGILLRLLLSNPPTPRYEGSPGVFQGCGIIVIHAPPSVTGLRRSPRLLVLVPNVVAENCHRHHSVGGSLTK